MWNRTENQIELVLIRHGATRANGEHRYLGKTEEELSEDGIRQLIESKRLLRYPRLDCLFISPKKRCTQTAEILYPELQPVIAEELAEMDFGAFEGKNHVDLQKDERYQAWIDSGGTLPFPGGESRSEFIIRCKKGFQRVRREIWKRQERGAVQTAGMIVHGGTIMALLSSYYGGDYFDYQAANGAGYICTLKERQKKTEMIELREL